MLNTRSIRILIGGLLAILVVVWFARPKSLRLSLEKLGVHLIPTVVSNKDRGNFWVQPSAGCYAPPDCGEAALKAALKKMGFRDSGFKQYLVSSTPKMRRYVTAPGSSPTMGSAEIMLRGRVIQYLTDYDRVCFLDIGGKRSVCF